MANFLNASRVTMQVGHANLIIEWLHGPAGERSGPGPLRRHRGVSAVTMDRMPEGTDFFPLTVDYREKPYAAGKFPGGFFKREGAADRRKEILTMRMIDRPIRPLFPEGFIDEVQIQALVLSADRRTIRTSWRSIALVRGPGASRLPFEGPDRRGPRRPRRRPVRRQPDLHQDLDESTWTWSLPAHEDGVNMIEVGGEELTEEVMLDAIALRARGRSRDCAMIRRNWSRRSASRRFVRASPDDVG